MSTNPTPQGLAPVSAAADPPLWQLMLHAYDNAPAPPRDAPDDWTDRVGYAAEILAVRNWLKQKLPEGGAWHVLLTAEAARAEAGE